MSNKMNQNILMNHLISTGFIYQSSEIYGGLANSWDLGPLGVLLKNNLKRVWWDYFVTKHHNMFGLDSNILLNSSVWKASGHIDNFVDPLIDCKECKNRVRADKLIENFYLLNNKECNINEKTSHEDLEKIISEFNVGCPYCQKCNWTSIRNFNLLFETYKGVVQEKKNILYLRPETAQGIFINFQNILRTTRTKVPFGVAQIGKAFRNEITPGNFIFRTREFEQMEIEFFCHENDEEAYFSSYLSSIENFLINVIKLDKSKIKQVDYPKEELAHYSKKTIDFFFNFPHGDSELWGLVNRGKFDLSVHENFSQKKLHCLDPITNERYIPSVIEPSVGVERLMYAVLINSYFEENINKDNKRIILKLPYNLAPYKFAILPLTSKLSKEAKNLYNSILDLNISAIFDVSGSIGKRYRRQDEIGTKYCITIDFNSSIKNTVTIRERDSMKQKRVSVKRLFKNINNIESIMK
ncbi:MAG: glycine--tRNA ligase [Mycoplasmoidaceae bacterium]